MLSDLKIPDLLAAATNIINFTVFLLVGSETSLVKSFSFVERLST